MCSEVPEMTLCTGSDVSCFQGAQTENQKKLFEKKIAPPASHMYSDI